ncbi:zinc finger homeobox protein 4-like [Eupeodes corollae]|uniref:zinc finger homeobox protein 4-like n=1 Tax=Eupeodes corollae TaxID=290404 RepID=UPI0024938C6D|nr:zinc finger homeobox protein 4-like [Eupeodes corollae]
MSMKMFFFVEDDSPRKYVSSTHSSPKIHAPSPPMPSPKPPPPSPPSLDTFSKKKSASFKRKNNCKDSELLKNELFQFAMANRRAEKEFMQLEHDEKMKSIIIEWEIKLKTLNMYP